jgi:hypothetical protein
VARGQSINDDATYFSACISCFEKIEAVVTVALGEYGVDWVGAFGAALQ